MTVDELILRLEAYRDTKHSRSDGGGGSHKVTIVTKDSTVGSRSMVNVVYANGGFDWENGLFILTPSPEVIINR